MHGLVVNRNQPSSSKINVLKTHKQLELAKLNEPLEAYAIPALQWWHLCRDTETSTSWIKPKLMNGKCMHCLALHNYSSK